MTSTTFSDEDRLQQRQLADFDRLIELLHQWAEAAPAWEPFDGARALIGRIEPRLRELQVRLDQVLVVGILGGSGTGKSTLINALVGERVSEAGDVQRPTTTRPVVLCHTNVDPSFLDLADAYPQVVRLGIPLLENMILIDCPDPDTQGGARSENENLDILRRVLPHCDVMLHLGTAQKYKTHAVTQELLRHAPGRQIVFVQTHAVVDADIRDDWRRYLEQAGFAIPTIFRVDSEQALARQEEHRPTPPEFAELVRFLQSELASRSRHRIKRANTLDLLDWLLAEIRRESEAGLPGVEKLEVAISTERTKLLQQVRTRLTQRIGENQHLWRSRLLRQVTDSWWGGPFTGFLRLTGSAGALLRLVPMARARSLVPLLVAGGYAVGKSLTDQWKESMAADEWIAGADLGIGPADLAQSRSVLDGYAQSAGIERTPLRQGSASATEHLRPETLVMLARQLYGRMEMEIDSAIARRVSRKAGVVFHFVLELLFCIVLGFLIYQVGRNFFYDHPFQDRPLLGLEYWIQAGVWVVVWGLLLRALLVMRLRSGLRRDVQQLLQDWTPDAALATLFDDLAALVAQIRGHALALRPVEGELARLQAQFGGVDEWHLGRLLNSRSGTPVPDNSSIRETVRHGSA